MAERVRVLEVVTPEQVTLALPLASPWTRFLAFVLDTFFVLLLSVPLLVLGNAAAAMAHLPEGIATGVLVPLAWLLRVAWFPGFELAHQGQTPGKRLLDLRVVMADGTPLTPAAALARNLSREAELSLPLAALSGASLFAPGTPGPLRLAAAAWMFLFGLLPLFQRRHARVGDLLAGTAVVRSPRAELPAELAAEGEETGHVPFRFLPAHLSVYGIHELQVLEDLLRREEHGLDPRVVEKVCETIRRRIGWPTAIPPRDRLLFLRSFYAQQRAFLERQVLLGRRKERKDAPPGNAP